MFRKGLVGLRRTALPLAMATVMLAGTSSHSRRRRAAAATSASRTLSSSAPTNGDWPGVGKICEPGPGGASSVRGVGSKTINIAVFNDAANTVEPGLEAEFPQQAQAFADWCNASGGIDGRHIVIDNRDAALFNAAQQATAACQSDFMAVGGGMALDQPSVPIREKCGLGQISGYVVSDASDLASDQVDPSGINTDYRDLGMVRRAGQGLPAGGQERRHGWGGHPLGPRARDEVRVRRRGAGLEGRDFLEPPVTVENWAPYVEDYQTKGVAGAVARRHRQLHPLRPGDDDRRLPPGLHRCWGPSSPTPRRSKRSAANPSLPPVYVETSWWPLSLASQNPSTEQLVNTMHTYAKGDSVDFDDEEGAEAWLLWAKAASACGADLTVSCVLNKAAAVKNWDAGGIRGTDSPA